MYTSLDRLRRRLTAEITHVQQTPEHLELLKLCLKLAALVDDALRESDAEPKLGTVAGDALRDFCHDGVPDFARKSR